MCKEEAKMVTIFFVLETISYIGDTHNVGLVHIIGDDEQRFLLLLLLRMHAEQQHVQCQR